MRACLPEGLKDKTKVVLMKEVPVEAQTVEPVIGVSVIQFSQVL